MKVLIIRFSSFGDIVQALGVPVAIKQAHPEAQIHWAVRDDFSDLLRAQKSIDRVWSLNRKDGFVGLLRLCGALRREGYTHIYDAHNNLRSFLVSLLVRAPNHKRRSKFRFLRFLLFRLRINRFPSPFVAQKSFLSPIATWLGGSDLPESPVLKVPLQTQQKLESVLKPIRPFVALAPSTAWAMKNWPLEHWIKLVETSPNTHFVVLGGPQDQECRVLAGLSRSGSGQTLNLAGQLTWLESCGVVEQSQGLISADTGLLHVADQLGKSSVALIGPTAFGFPARSSTMVLEVPLPCRPCTKDGRGRCVNKIQRQCMYDITPELVAQKMSRFGLSGSV